MLRALSLEPTTASTGIAASTSNSKALTAFKLAEVLAKATLSREVEPSSTALLVGFFSNVAQLA